MWPGIVRHFLSHVLASKVNHGVVRRIGPMHVHGILTSERFNRWLKGLSAATAHSTAGIAKEFEVMLCLDLERLSNDPRLAETPAYLSPDIRVCIPTAPDPDRANTRSIEPGSAMERAIHRQWEKNYHGYIRAAPT